MKKFENFKLFNNLDPYRDCIYLKKFIDKNLNNKKLNIFFFQIEKIFDVPVKVQKRKIGKLILNNFNFKINKFEINNNYTKIIYNFLLFNLLIFINIFFSCIKFKKERFDIILANVDGDNIDKFRNLLKNYPKVAIISKKKKEYHNLKKTFPKKSLSHFKSNFLNYKISFNDFIVLYSIYFKIFYFSLHLKQNYIFFFNHLLSSILTYSSLSKILISKSLIYGRLYWTCPIINFFFKKNQKTFSYVIQSQIFDLIWGMYMDADIYFSFGSNQEQKKEILLAGGRINKIVPVGSLAIEKYLKKKNFVFNIMIIISHLNTWFNFRNVKDSYNEFFIWIKKIKNDFPRYKMIFFCFSNDYDQARKINNFIKDNNMKAKMIMKSGACYKYLSSADFVFSYSSTFILEAASIGKKAYFLQPGVGATTILKKNYLKKIIIKKYSTLKKILINKNRKKTVRKDICLPSNFTSENICIFLKKNIEYHNNI